MIKPGSSRNKVEVAEKARRKRRRPSFAFTNREKERVCEEEGSKQARELRGMRGEKKREQDVVVE